MRGRGVAAGTFVAVLVYCLVNLLFFLTTRPYFPQTAELLENADFTDGLRAWRIEGEARGISVDGGILTIDHPTPVSTTLLQCWPARELPQPLIFSAEARTEGVVRGVRSWHEARIDLVGYDPRGRGIYRTHTRLLGLDGTRPWQPASSLFRLPSAAERACAEISLYTASGRFQVRALSLAPAVASRFHQAGRWLLLAGWVWLAVWLAGPLYRYLRGAALGRWLLLVGVLLLVGILMPYGIRQQLEAWILHGLSLIGLPLRPDEPLGSESAWALWPSQWDLSKFAHLAGFTLLAALLTADRRAALGRVAAALCLLAVTTETLQFFVPLRTPRLSDVVVDGLGVALGVAVGAWVSWRHRRRALRRG